MDVALLAPVPEEHLIAGEAIARERGKVAFGSRAWELFRELDRIRTGHPVPAYIYASWSSNPVGSKVTWTGDYIGYVDGIGGAHPTPELRPPSTYRYADDNQGWWAIFWHVAGLRRLDPAEWISIRNLRSFKADRFLASSFVPEGPILVSH